MGMYRQRLEYNFSCYDKNNNNALLTISETELEKQVFKHLITHNDCNYPPIVTKANISINKTIDYDENDELYAYFDCNLIVDIEHIEKEDIVLDSSDTYIFDDLFNIMFPEYEMECSENNLEYIGDVDLDYEYDEF